MPLMLSMAGGSTADRGESNTRVRRAYGPHANEVPGAIGAVAIPNPGIPTERRPPWSVRTTIQPLLSRWSIKLADASRGPTPINTCELFVGRTRLAVLRCCCEKEEGTEQVVRHVGGNLENRRAVFVRRVRDAGYGHRQAPPEVREAKNVLWDPAHSTTDREVLIERSRRLVCAALLRSHVGENLAHLAVVIGGGRILLILHHKNMRLIESFDLLDQALGVGWLRGRCRCCQ